jgi:hypothetical protein
MMDFSSPESAESRSISQRPANVECGNPKTGNHPQFFPVQLSNILKHQVDHLVAS